MSAPGCGWQCSGKNTLPPFNAQWRLAVSAPNGAAPKDGSHGFNNSPALAPGREREQMLVRVTAPPPSRAIVVGVSTSGSELGGIIKAVPSSNLPPPNPSFERTRHGRSLQAFISFWALRALPAQAAHGKR